MSIALAPTILTQYKFHISDILYKYTNIVISFISQIQCLPLLPTIYYIGLAKLSNNLLYKSVIYNLEALVHIIYNKTYLIGELESIYKQLYISAGDLFIEDQATILVIGILSSIKYKLKFYRTAYILSIDIILVFV